MKDTQHKAASSRIKSWMYFLGGLIVLQILFIAFDNALWTPFKVKEGSLFADFSESKLFTEWFTPYKTQEHNLFTAIFAVTLLPAALIGAVKDFVSRK